MYQKKLKSTKLNLIIWQNLNLIKIKDKGIKD